MALTLSSSYLRFIPHAGKAPYAIAHVAAALQLGMLLWYTPLC